MKEFIRPLLGQRAWGARLGIGSFLTIEFGSVANLAERHLHGEWHLWVYGCKWRITEGDTLVGSSEHDREVLDCAVARLNGLILEVVDIPGPTLAAIWRFAGNLLLQLVADPGNGLEQWMLFRPDGRVLTADSGGSHSYRVEH